MPNIDISIPFSAFWLRSSVVSVLISLISDTWTNGLNTVACYWSSCVSSKRCTTAWAWHNPPNPSFKFLWPNLY
ncbi:hypothetical protein D8674_009576 [Pyrus ussuriensis x Pyrus communis]|uniref:Secreted protein n=1 Tax=Pyrus ussuriensis x Pyrus communis TaxID=2448454 RepID=A0A5N5F8D3_9ROSA|nr:hypothetical protein D8674_009576 [Pyrus ussuriensis x Pyrus communis]